VLTPDETTDGKALRTVSALVSGLGARPIEVAPALHDRLVATVSHLPYLAAVALTRAVGEAEERDLLALLAAGGFRDLTRVASGSPRMSRDMVVANRDALRGALQAFSAQLEAVAALLDEPEALLDVAEAAKRQRDALPIVRRSLLPARHEVVIAVPDRPGELMRITGALGETGVNIKDIEVLAVRESGGAVRLAFADGASLARGTEALRAAGYEARGRGNAGTHPPPAGDPNAGTHPPPAGDGSADARDALFELAVERADTFTRRARLPGSRDAAALKRALEPWHARTRFAARIPLEAIAAALATRPEGAGWAWRGGPEGSWQRSDPQRGAGR
jgi:hypothetical protein